MIRLAALALGFLLMVAFWPGLSGMATMPRWDVAALIGVAVVFAPATRMTGAHWAGLALVAWLIVSLAWSDGQGYGVDTAWKLLAVGAAFVLGGAIDDLRPMVAGAAAGLAISSLIAVAQWFGWHGIDMWSGSPAGLFWNGNRLAEVAVIVFAAALAARLWCALPGLMPAIALPYERTAWLALAVVVAIWTWRRIDTFERFITAAIAGWAIIGIALVATTWRTEQFGLSGIAERLALWKFTAANLTLLGHGLGSFQADAPLFAWGGVLTSLGTHPHNEYLWMAYEGGLPAIGLFGAFAVFVWRRATRAGGGGFGLVLIAVAIEACLAMPLHDPATVLFAALVAGHVARDRRDLRGAVDARGNLLRARHEPIYGDRSRDGRPDAGAEPLSV